MKQNIKYKKIGLNIFIEFSLSMALILISNSSLYAKIPGSSIDTLYRFSYGQYEYKIELRLMNEKYAHIYSETFFKDSLVYKSKWFLPYPIYRFFIADADNDGMPDIGVGVIKKTRFDKIKRKRPFFFKIIDGAVRPLWLGSKLGLPLEDFLPEKIAGKTYIKSMEIEKNGKYLIALYIWKGFGLKFHRFLYRNLGKQKAYKIFWES